MNFIFRQDSLISIAKYNQRLVIICLFLSFSLLILCVKTLTKNEKWILVPSSHIDKRIEIYSKGYSESYLKEWASYVMHTLMTTSHDTINRQIEEIKNISSSSHALDNYFIKLKNFIQGSNIQSVYFPKKITVYSDNVLVEGLFRYWMGSSDKNISQEKSYRLYFKRSINDLLLLIKIEEDLNNA